MEYKVGDKIKIKSLEWYKTMTKNSFGTIDYEDNRFTKDMTKYCGKEAIIEENDGGFYRLNIDVDYLVWSSWMFEDEQDLLVEIKEDEILSTKSLSKELYKERRFQCACMAMQGIISGIVGSVGLIKIDYPSIAKEAYLLAEELIKQGGFTE